MQELGIADETMLGMMGSSKVSELVCVHTKETELHEPLVQSEFGLSDLDDFEAQNISETQPLSMKATLKRPEKETTSVMDADKHLLFIKER